MEYSSRRVYTSSSPRPKIATSYSYTANPISRRRNKPAVTITRVYRPIHSPLVSPLGDQEILHLATTPTRSRQFVATDLPGDRERIRDDGSSYTRSFTSTSSTNNRTLGGDDDGFGYSGYGPRGSNNNSNNSENKSYFKKTETTTRDNGSGPQRQTYSSEKTTTRTDGDTPSFFSSTSYRTPQGSAGRAGSVPRVAVQRLSSTPPPRSSTRLHQLYSELEDEVAANSQGLGALVPSYSFRRSLTPLRGETPIRAYTPMRELSPGPIRSITYHRDRDTASRERESAERQLSQLSQLQTLPEITRQSYQHERNNLDEILLQLAMGNHPPLYSLHHIPLRSASDVKEICDIRRQYVHERNLYDPLSRTQSEIYRLAFNRQPRKTPAGYIAGNGTLACLTYAGGRPIPKRRRFYPGDEEENKNNDSVYTDGYNKFNNYYKPSAVGSYYSTAGRKPVYQPIYRSKKSLLGLPDTPRGTKKPVEVESKWESYSKGKRSPTPPPIRVPRPVISSPPPEDRPRRNFEPAPAPAPAPKPAGDNVVFTLRRPKKSVTELELPSDFNQSPPSPKSPTLLPPEAEASVVFKIPRRSISQEPPAPVIPEPEVEAVAAPEDVETVQVVRLKKPSLKPAVTEPEPEPEPEPAREPTPPPPQQPEPEPEPEPVAEPEPEMEPVPEAAPEPEPEPEVAAAAVEEPEAVVEEVSSAGGVESEAAAPADGGESVGGADEEGSAPASASVAEDEETKGEEIVDEAEEEEEILDDDANSNAAGDVLDVDPASVSQSIDHLNDNDLSEHILDRSHSPTRSPSQSPSRSPSPESIPGDEEEFSLARSPSPLPVEVEETESVAAAEPEPEPETAPEPETEVEAPVESEPEPTPEDSVPAQSEAEPESEPAQASEPEPEPEPEPEVEAAETETGVKEELEVEEVQAVDDEEEVPAPEATEEPESVRQCVSEEADAEEAPEETTAAAATSEEAEAEE